jgi:hypothetical protein
MSLNTPKLLAAALGVALIAVIAVYAVQTQQADEAPGLQSASRVMEVYKTPTCGCCTLWVEHMQAAGFTVTAYDVSHAELDTVRARHGVPQPMYSCHTGLIDGYVIEGHIPAAEVARFLKQPPAGAAGLAVPGMPLGSPGMEVPGVQPRPYTVMTFDRQGRTEVFATVRP